MIRSLLGLFIFVFIMQLTSLALGDAIVRNFAMKASTIAQFYIEDKRIRLDLEIGLEDLAAFHNLMPDKIREKMNLPTEDYAARVARFFKNDLAILVDGTALPGRMLKIMPAKRIEREPISGSPVAVKAEDQQDVIQISLEYKLPQKVDELILSGSRMSPIPSIGFVVYHKGIAINDFRFLPVNAVLKLDWDDPWYSSFTTRNMRRTYSSAMSGFLYVEPYEVRKEIIIRPKDIQKLTDLGLDSIDIITPEMYPQIFEKLAQFLDQRLPVKIDGVPVTGELIRLNFLRRTLTSSQVISPPEDISLDSAIIGAIYVFPTDGLPQQVDMEWDIFHQKIDRIAAATVDQAGPFRTYLEEGFTTLTWNNFLKNPKLPTLVDLIKPPTLWQKIAFFLFYLMLVSALVGLVFFLIGWKKQKQISKPLIVTTIASLLVAGISYEPGHKSNLDNNRTEKLVSDLLHNVYRAFDYRKDEQIYDVLAKSVSGDLLSEIFLETKRGLVLENQGGARAKVQEVKLTQIQMEESSDSHINGTLTWTVKGNVGHWGHIHSRSNRYRAELLIEPVENAWKLTEMRILEEERIVE